MARPSSSRSARTHGCAAGQLTVTCFCLAYGRLAPGRRPLATLAAALTCSAPAAILATVIDNILLTAALSALLVTAGLLTWPDSPEPRPRQAAAQQWELPARMAISAAMVAGSTEVAVAAGPFVGGIASSLPILLCVMGPSAHRTSDAVASEMMHGALISCLATISFLTVLALTLKPLGYAVPPHQAGAQATAASTRSSFVTLSSASQASMAPANPCAMNRAMTWWFAVGRSGWVERAMNVTA